MEPSDLGEAQCMEALPVLRPERLGVAEISGAVGRGTSGRRERSDEIRWSSIESRSFIPKLVHHSLVQRIPERLTLTADDLRRSGDVPGALAYTGFLS